MRWSTVRYAAPAFLAAALLCACAGSPAKPNVAGLCSDLGQVTQLISDSGHGLSAADQIVRIQSLESRLSADAMSLGEQGDAGDGTSAARIAVALGNWKTDISLAQDPTGVEQGIEGSIAGIGGCG